MRFIAYTLISFISLSSLAQPTLSLRPVVILDSASQGLSSSYHQSFDSLSKSQITDLNLVDYLSKRSSVNFKNYGPGLLSTPTFRGGDANHTQLLWNGMRLNSPMLGTIDFSTIPINQFNRVSIVTGNSSNLFTNGGLGGGILLNQSPNYTNNQVGVSQLFSSFGNYSSLLQINSRVNVFGKPASFGLTADMQSLANQFPYVDISKNSYPEVMMHDAGLSRLNISPMFSIAATNSLSFDFIYWYSETKRNIPSAINSPHSIAEQHDVAQRAMLIAKYRASQKLSFSIRSMFDDNINSYSDSSINIDNSNDFRSLQNQIDASYKPFRSLEIAGQLNHTLIEAESKNYNEAHLANAQNAMINARYFMLKRKLLIEAGYRYSSFDENQAWLPFGGITISPFHKFPLSFIASGSYTARFPTLNEKYWLPGGNPDLKTERGKLIETGLKFTSDALEMSLIGFSGEFNDRIRWLPSQGLFVPSNVDYSTTQGIDLNFRKSIALNKHELVFLINAEYIKALGGVEGSDLNQLSFIPMWSGNSSIEYAFRGFHFSYSYQYFGKRFITSDESAFMPAYQLSSFTSSYSISLGHKTTLRLTTAIDNAFDWQYQNIPWRPMPGRFYSFKIDLKWLD